MRSIDVTPIGLRDSSAEIVRVVEQTDTMLEAFQGQLDSAGAPWGDDELGAAIREVYEGAHAMVMNCYHSNLDTMDGYAERLVIAADLLEETDQGIKAQIKTLLATWGRTLP